MGEFNFEKQLNESLTPDIFEKVEAFLLETFTDAKRIHAAHPDNDKSGADLWIERAGKNFLAVDLKTRKKDCKTYGNDDVALESWSVIASATNKQKIGWTIDPLKITDLVVFMWLDTDRMTAIWFKYLFAAFITHKDEWMDAYQVDKQSTTTPNNKWESECVFVPRSVIQGALDKPCWYVN